MLKKEPANCVHDFPGFSQSRFEKGVAHLAKMYTVHPLNTSETVGAIELLLDEELRYYRDRNRIMKINPPRSLLQCLRAPSRFDVDAHIVGLEEARKYIDLFYGCSQGCDIKQGEIRKISPRLLHSFIAFADSIFVKVLEHLSNDCKSKDAILKNIMLNRDEIRSNMFKYITTPGEVRDSMNRK